MVHLDESVADLPGIRLPHPIQGLGGGGGIRLAGSVTGIEYGWYPRSVGLDEAGDGAGIVSGGVAGSGLGEAAGTAAGVEAASPTRTVPSPRTVTVCRGGSTGGGGGGASGKM